MQIELRALRPHYIDADKQSRSQIWGCPLVVAKGVHMHIVAPSGSGKTTLIHFLYGLRKDFAGSVLYDNTDIRELSAERHARFRQQQISIVFQDLRLFGDLTAKENIEIKRLLAPYHPEEKIYEMAGRLGIAQKMHQTAGTCSYGEQQRIAIIRALMQPFDFILLDEPYSHLDEANREIAMELIYEECEKRQAAMIFADLKPIEFLKGEKILYL